MECVKLFLGCLVMLTCVYGTMGANCSTIVEDMDACYTSRGFPAPSQQLTSEGLPSLAGLTDRFGADVCSSKQSDLVEAVKCALQLSQNCVADLVAILPSPDQAEEMVSFECEQRAVDVDCISRNINTQDLLTCVQDAVKKLIDSLGTSDLTLLFCGAIDASFKCVLPGVKKFGCPAVKYMAKYAKGSLRPTVCGASTLDLDTGSCDGGAAIVSHPAMLILGLFTIMIKFYLDLA